jgi:spectinomycin phosphotransferase
MRESPRITEEDLRACLQDQYDLRSVTLTFLPLGHDYDARIYRVESEQGTAYALKVTSRSLYGPRCLVPRYLNDQGGLHRSWLPFPLVAVRCGPSSRIGP